MRDGGRRRISNVEQGMSKWKVDCRANLRFARNDPIRVDDTLSNGAGRTGGINLLFMNYDLLLKS